MNAQAKKTSKTAGKTETQLIRESDEAMDKLNAAAHKELALSLPAIVARDPYIEWVIVHNYLQRENLIVKPHNDALAERLLALGNVDLDSEEGKAAVLAVLDECKEK